MQPAPVAVVLHSASNMDFQFTHYLGNVHAKCPMEHIALANWFNSEVRSNLKRFLTALLPVSRLKIMMKSRWLVLNTLLSIPMK